MNATDVLREFVADVDAVHDWARKEWPDLMVTYRKAKGLLDEPPIPYEMTNCAGPCKGPIANNDAENLCFCCGLYFCDICWDSHDECELCVNCGQMHITTPCPV